MMVRILSLFLLCVERLGEKLTEYIPHRLGVQFVASQLMRMSGRYRGVQTKRIGFMMEIHILTCTFHFFGYVTRMRFLRATIEAYNVEKMHEFCVTLREYLEINFVGGRETHLCGAVRVEKPLFLSDLEKFFELLAAVISDEGAFVQILVATNYR